MSHCFIATISGGWFNLITISAVIVAVVSLSIAYYYRQRLRQNQFPGYKEVFKNLRNQEFLVNYSNYLSAADENFQHHIQVSLKILGRYTKVSRIYIFEDYGNGRMTRNTFEWCNENIEPEISKYQRIAYKLHLPGWKSQLIKDGVLIVHQGEGLPAPLAEILLPRKAKSVLIFPLYFSNEFHGFIGFDTVSKKTQWRDIEVSFLKTITLILCNAFERHIINQEIKTSERELLSAIIQAEEKERGRLARDLHDGLGPLLSSLKLYTAALGKTTDAAKRVQILTSTSEVIDESMLMIKEISNNLSPHVLNEFGLSAAIQSFCKKITLTKAIDIKFDSNVTDQRFDIDTETVLFRVLKELVNNTIKHALATTIEIFLLRTEHILTLIYSDNGVGFNLKKVLDDRASGMGISNIVNRIGSLHGKLMFENNAGKGIQMKIEVELKTQLNE